MMTLRWFGLLLLAVSHAASALELVTGLDDEAQMPFWEIHDQDMSLRLVQRLPDQTRGFFLARGFSAAQANDIARSCVFQTVFHNTAAGRGAGPLRYDLQQWEVNHGGSRRPPKTRERWRQMWSDETVTPAARLALEWALYPTEQTYQPGDFNWGMTTFGLPPGSQFRLTVVWQQGGRQHRYRFDAIRCAADETREPEAGS